MIGHVDLATSADAASLSALHRQAFAPHEGWSEAQFSSLLALETTLALQAKNQSGLAGLILMQTAFDTADMLTLAVAPAERRSGLARLLIEAVIDRLQTSDVQRLMLDVAADNFAAIGLYQALGFNQDTRRSGYYKRKGGLRVDAVLMSRAIAGQS